MAQQGYQNNLEHIFDELARVDLLLKRQVARFRRSPVYANFDEFRGVYISDDEIDALSRQAPGWENRLPGDNADNVGSVQAALDQLENKIARKSAVALQKGVSLRLPRLVQMFKLAPFDRDVLLICLAPEIDLKYQKIFAYLQNDVSRRAASVNLVLTLLCRNLAEKIAARNRFHADAPLLQSSLIAFPPETAREHNTFLSRTLEPDARIVDFLLSVDAGDEQIRSFTRQVHPSGSLPEILLPAALKERLWKLFRLTETNGNGTMQRNDLRLCLIGEAGTGKKLTAQVLCAAAGLPLLVLDFFLLQRTGAAMVPALRRVFREARLTSAALYIDCRDTLAEGSEGLTALNRVLGEQLPGFEGVLFLGSRQPEVVSLVNVSDRFVKIELPLPEYSQRIHYYQYLLCREETAVDGDADLADIAGKFHFSCGRIAATVHAARQSARLRNPEQPKIAREDLHRACREQSSLKLERLAQKITPLFGWDDIILPPDSLQQLKEITAHVKYRQKVFNEWQFDKKISLGKGISALFVGPSGTGKTMAAEILSAQLQLDLYKIDLSQVVSKYIGETEKNLKTIFEEAQKSYTILFFDEADAIFGKRSEVKDSHDRYANIEINYLLQMMETFEGIVILASNFKKNIDEAFTRRLRFVVEFPFPDEQDRAQIWRKIFPPETPLNHDIDFPFLAKRFKLTGGSIKNIALSSAFMAAQNSGVVDMVHVIRATRREFQKMGRLCVKTDFGPYYDLLENQPDLNRTTK